MNSMAKVTLCADGFDISDQVFTIELDEQRQIETFVQMVKSGGVKSGLRKPAVIIKTRQGEQVASERNNWFVDAEML
jgi:hypothetical protein